mmetsp:Transcript_122440/g.215688  ORF Transcript_122440/g.215688 Transcript_122440/m.215688 type:complete len:360 (+) Transcript_122440:108-1187(+)
MKRDFDDEDDELLAKRLRAAAGGFGFGEDPNAELDAMIAAASGGEIAAMPAAPTAGFSGVLGMGAAGGFPGGFGGGDPGSFGKGGGGGKGGGKGGPGPISMGGKIQGLDNLAGLVTEPKVATTAMDFTRLSRDVQPSRDVPIPKDLVEYLMTPEHRQLLTEESGAEVDWAPEDSKVQLRGSAEQIKKAQRLLTRVITHCHWGRSESKVKRLLKPRIVESVNVRLSPMNTLRPSEKTLSSGQPVFSIGKDKTNDAVIQDAVISRQHCVLELDSERGAVYVLDCSTNGTFLNGTRLPSKSAGKVLLTHGDELCLKDPNAGEPEFGYIVNINELHVRAELKLEAPRRLLTAEEQSTIHRDFA